jgi:hypothetical protein
MFAGAVGCGESPVPVSAAAPAPAGVVVASPASGVCVGVGGAAPLGTNGKKGAGGGGGSAGVLSSGKSGSCSALLLRYWRRCASEQGRNRRRRCTSSSCASIAGAAPGISNLDELAPYVPNSKQSLARSERIVFRSYYSCFGNGSFAKWRGEERRERGVNALETTD